jgi:hypothetical protein
MDEVRANIGQISKHLAIFPESLPQGFWQSLELPPIPWIFNLCAFMVFTVFS